MHDGEGGWITRLTTVNRKTFEPMSPLVWVWLAVTVAVLVFLRRPPPGRRLYAFGDNLPAARRALVKWRLRVGDWRVRFSRDPETRTVLILRVLPRGRAYRG